MLCSIMFLFSNNMILQIKFLTISIIRLYSGNIIQTLIFYQPFYITKAFFLRQFLHSPGLSSTTSYTHASILDSSWPLLQLLKNHWICLILPILSALFPCFPVYPPASFQINAGKLCMFQKPSYLFLLYTAFRQITISQEPVSWHFSRFLL